VFFLWETSIFAQKLTQKKKCVYMYCVTSNSLQERLDKSYIDAWSKVHGDADGYTIGPNYPDPMWLPARFDRLLYRSSSWDIKSVELLGGTAISTGVFPSDHLGILGTFVKV
jgi:hypothetical protein